MAQLIVRNLEEELVLALKRRAAGNGRSAEEEHRQILRNALRPGKSKVSLKELLTRMPELEEEADLARSSDRGRAVDL
jgi:antitoxin FitA